MIFMATSVKAPSFEPHAGLLSDSMIFMATSVKVPSFEPHAGLLSDSVFGKH